MAAKMALFWLLVLGVIVRTKQFELDFAATPANLTYPLTEQLKLRCSLKDHDGDTSRKDIGLQRHAPDSDSSDEKLTHVMSIIVTRGQSKTYVASVTQFTPAQALADHDLLQVEGVVSGLTTDRGAYLELTWTPPGPSQTGAYRCEINALEENGHSVLLAKSLRIRNVKPTISEISDFVQDNRQVVKALNESLSKVDDSNKALQSELDALKRKMKNDEKKYENLSKAVQRNKAHTETGHGNCGTSNTWPRTSGCCQERKIYVTTKFSKPYDVAPKVLASISYYYPKPGRQNSMIWLGVVNVTTKEFTVDCRTYYDAHLWHTRFEWMSTN